MPQPPPFTHINTHMSLSFFRSQPVVGTLAKLPKTVPICYHTHTVQLAIYGP